MFWTNLRHTIKLKTGEIIDVRRAIQIDAVEQNAWDWLKKYALRIKNETQMLNVFLKPQAQSVHSKAPWLSKTRSHLLKSIGKFNNHF